MYDDADGFDIEREHADHMQAAYEAEGRAYARAQSRMRAALARDARADAADLCRHGGGYPLSSPAAHAERDPRAGQDGVRCADCGSVLSAFPFDDPDYTVLVACEPGASLAELRVK